MGRIGRIQYALTIRTDGVVSMEIVPITIDSSELLGSLPFHDYADLIGHGFTCENACVCFVEPKHCCG